MKTVTLIATEYGAANHGLNNSVIALDITIENDAWSDDEVLNAIKDAAKDYCLTDDGKEHTMATATTLTLETSLPMFQKQFYNSMVSFLSKKKTPSP